MKGKFVALAIGIVVFGTSSLVNADIVQLPLSCEGVYDINTPSWTMDFDLGVTFTEISKVYIDWSGEITGKDTMNAGIIDALFVATLYELDPHDYFGRAYIQGGSETYPDPEPFNLRSNFSEADDQNWAQLLDGKAGIEIFFGETSHPLDLITLSFSSGTLDSAKIVVDGNIIPEPTTFLLFFLGELFLIKRK